jgi:hypothetical protein
LPDLIKASAFSSKPTVGAEGPACTTGRGGVGPRGRWAARTWPLGWRTDCCTGWRIDCCTGAETEIGGGDASGAETDAECWAVDEEGVTEADVAALRGAWVVGGAFGVAAPARP